MKDSPNCSNSGFRYLSPYESGPPPCIGLPPLSPRERTAHTRRRTKLTFARRWWKTRSRNAKLEKVQRSVRNNARANAQRGEAVNNLSNDVPKFVTQARAS